MKNFDCLRNFLTFILSKANWLRFFDFQVRVTDKKMAYLGPIFVMNRTDLATFEASQIQVFRPLLATFGNG
jgi:hypothetical protein